MPAHLTDDRAMICFQNQGVGIRTESRLLRQVARPGGRERSVAGWVGEARDAQELGDTRIHRETVGSSLRILGFNQQLPGNFSRQCCHRAANLDGDDT